MMDKETIRQIKSDFFALRNGVIADKLRSAGCPYKIIFGLTGSVRRTCRAAMRKNL